MAEPDGTRDSGSRSADGREEEDDNRRSERERIRATALDLIRQLGLAPPQETDPYASVITRFGQLPEHVRFFLQELSSADIRTLTRTVVTLQRTGAAVRALRRLAIWMLGAFGIMVAFGQNIVGAVQLVKAWLW
jgi:hypothetical protein